MACVHVHGGNPKKDDSLSFLQNNKLLRFWLNHLQEFHIQFKSGSRLQNMIESIGKRKRWLNLSMQKYFPSISITHVCWCRNQVRILEVAFILINYYLKTLSTFYKLASGDYRDFVHTLLSIPNLWRHDYCPLHRWHERDTKLWEDKKKGLENSAGKI